MHRSETDSLVKPETCREPLSFATLVDYWVGDLSPESEAPIEEHLFGCASCTRRLEELAALAAGIRGAFRHGAVHAVITRALLSAMKKENLQLREYRLSPGGSVNCTIAAADDYVVSRLQASLTGLKRVDVLTMDAQGAAQSRYEDVPFDEAAGEVLVCPAPAKLKKRSAFTQRVRLIAVDERGERTLGEYTFVHTPS